MIHFRLVSLFVLLSTATACANHSSGSGVAPAYADFGWNDVCYDGFAEDAIKLGGSAAEDCGILHRNEHYSGLNPPDQCLRPLLASKRAFRAALSSYGNDSRYCEAAIRDQAGNLYHIWLDFDVTGQWGSDGANAVLSVSRCKRIQLRPGTIGPGSYFDLSGCEPDEALSAKMIGRGYQE